MSMKLAPQSRASAFASIVLPAQGVEGWARARARARVRLGEQQPLPAPVPGLMWRQGAGGKGGRAPVPGGP